MRLSLIVSTGTGEQASIDSPNWNPVTGEMLVTVDEQRAAFRMAFEEADYRRQQMAMRVLEVHQVRKFFSPEVWPRIVGIIDILAGRISAEDLIMRWLSEQEEQEALEQGRMEALQAHLNGSVNDTITPE